MIVTDVFALWYIAKAINITDMDQKLTRYKTFRSLVSALAFKDRNDIKFISMSNIIGDRYIIFYEDK